MQAQTINFSVPKVLLRAIDYRAQSEARTRSGLIQEAIRVYLARRTNWEQIFEYGKKQAIKTGARASNLEKTVDDYRDGN